MAPKEKRPIEYSPMHPAASALPPRPRPGERVPEIFAPLLAVTDEADLAAKVEAAAKRLGFDSFTYGAAIRFRDEWEPWYASWTTLPREWVWRYHVRNYVEIDPRLVAGLLSPTPVFWDRSILGGSSQTDAFLDDAASFGLCSGIGFHMHGPGAEHFMAAFNSSHPSCDWITDDIAGQAYLFASHFHRWFRDAMVGGRFKPGARGQPITARERECLAYLARGYTNGEIASAMGIKERTVGFHVGQLLVKLEAANRTEAVTRALRDNLVAG